MSDHKMIDWQSAAITHRGNVRAYNEDAYVAHPEYGVWAVADGMGGHHAGDVASREVVAGLAKVAGAKSWKELETTCHSQLQAVNAKLFKEGMQQQAQIIGSTVVCMIASERQAAMLWAGDSRGYQLRDNKLTQLTSDHSRTNELIAKGILKPEAAESHPDANVITRAVGVAQSLEVDQIDFSIQTGDIYLLCSDGLTRYVAEPELVRCLNLPTCQAAVEELLRLTLANEARDNVSAIVMKATEADNSTTVFNYVADAESEDMTLLNLGDD